MFNTEDLYDDVMQGVLQQYGHDFNKNLKLKLMGLHVEEVLQIIKDEFQLTATVDELIEKTDHQIDEIFARDIQAQPGLFELLDLLEAMNIPKGLTTSARMKNVAFGFNKYNLHDRFEFKLTAESVEVSKPEPEIYLKAASNFGIDPANMLVLEDSVLGSLAGSRAGAFTVAIPTIHSEDMDYSHADLVVESLSDKRLHSLLKPL